jgi:hypothetical protein
MAGLQRIARKLGRIAMVNRKSCLACALNLRGLWGHELSAVSAPSVDGIPTGHAVKRLPVSSDSPRLIADPVTMLRGLLFLSSSPRALPPAKKS